MGSSVKTVMKYCPKCKVELVLLGKGKPSCPTCGPSAYSRKEIHYCPNCHYVEVDGKPFEEDEDDDEESEEEYTPDLEAERNSPGLGGS